MLISQWFPNVNFLGFVHVDWSMVSKCENLHQLVIQGTFITAIFHPKCLHFLEKKMVFPFHIISPCHFLNYVRFLHVD